MRKWFIIRERIDDSEYDQMKLTPLTPPALWNYHKYELVAGLVVTGAWPGAQRHGVWPQNYPNQRSPAVSLYPTPLLYLRYPCITINPPYQFSPPRLGPDLEPELDIGPAKRTQIETNHLCGDCLKAGFTLGTVAQLHSLISGPYLDPHLVPAS